MQGAKSERILRDNGTITNLSKDSTINEDPKTSLRNEKKEKFDESAMWSFDKISKSSISGTQKESRVAVENKFKNLIVEINKTSVIVRGVCSFEYYKSYQSLLDYYRSEKP